VGTYVDSIDGEDVFCKGLYGVCSCGVYGRCDSEWGEGGEEDIASSVVAQCVVADDTAL